MSVTSRLSAAGCAGVPSRAAPAQCRAGIRAAAAPAAGAAQPRGRCGALSRRHLLAVAALVAIDDLRSTPGRSPMRWARLAALVHRVSSTRSPISASRAGSCVPLGILLLVLAALSHRRRLPRIAHGVLAALAVRLGFLFVAIALPGLFVDHRQAPDRPRAAVRRRRRRSVLLSCRSSGGRPTRACRPAMRPPRSRPRSRSGALWPRAASAAVDLCADRSRSSRVVVTAHHPSDVLAGALVGALGALLVRHWFAARRLGLRGRPRSARAAACRALAGGASKAVARAARSPNRSCAVLMKPAA